MSTADENFLKELQEKCLSESAEYMGEFWETLREIQSNTLGCLQNLLRPCHSLKGNLQAVGYLQCGELLHHFETILVSVEAQLKEASGTLTIESSQLLEGRLSAFIQIIENYLACLGKNKNFQEIQEAAENALQILEKWEPEFAGPVTQEKISSPSAVTQKEADAKTMVNPEVPKELLPNPDHKNLDVSQQQLPAPYLYCRTGKFNLAIPIENVIEIVKSGHLTPLPYARPSLLGLLNLRGEIMPIVNLGNTFGLQEKNKKRSCIVVCKVNADHFGLPVEEADQVIEIPPASLQKVEDVKEEVVSARFIQQVYFKEEGAILIVDVNRVLTV